LGDFLIAILEPQQTLFEFRQRADVVWRKHLPLDHREVDFDLVKPTSVNWRMKPE
jgi:hypothetical protein